MSFAASSMWDVIGVPKTKAPINVATFISYVLPPILFYFLLAALAIKLHTRTLRMALWPVFALFAWRAVFSVVIELSIFELEFHSDLAGPMWLLVSRSLHWALAKEPLVRRLRPVNSTPSTLVDALDLAFTCRGHGWDWANDMYIPPETRPSNHSGFIFHVALSAVAHVFVCGILHKVVQSLSSVGLGSALAASTFDESLPFLVQYARSSIITIIATFAIYAFLQLGYDMCTLLGVLLLGQDPTQWPPIFDSPWLATSLTQFWGRRWHQVLRHMFLIQAGYPLAFIFGRMGLVIGAFLASAVFHHITFNSLDGKSELWRMVVGYGMMALGILAEHMFKRLTGRKVCGLVGWFWTMTWLVMWGNVVVEGYVRAGLFKFNTLIDVIPPLRSLVERLVMDFDVWLHKV